MKSGRYFLGQPGQIDEDREDGQGGDQAEEEEVPAVTHGAGPSSAGSPGLESEGTSVASGDSVIRWMMARSYARGLPCRRGRG